MGSAVSMDAFVRFLGANRAWNEEIVATLSVDGACRAAGQPRSVVTGMQASGQRSV